MLIFTTILGSLLFLLGPFFFIVTLRYVKGIHNEKKFIVAGFINTVIYFVCVTFPYHFQGYSQVKLPSSKMSSFGIVNYEPVKSFDFIYVSLGFGFWWLFISLLLVGFGKFSNKKLNVTIKSILLVCLAFQLVYLQSYENTIGVILE